MFDVSGQFAAVGTLAGGPRDVVAEPKCLECNLSRPDKTLTVSRVLATSRGLYLEVAEPHAPAPGILRLAGGKGADAPRCGGRRLFIEFGEVADSGGPRAA